LPTGSQPFPQDIREQTLGRVHFPSSTATQPKLFIIPAALVRLRETAVHV
jgi:hypothetical protein